ncbi:MAG: (Fe-S)-binding protein [Peptococcaceae bacterium]|nr:(Fe-S)-binding protein [Peptococcaceae bacterium]
MADIVVFPEVREAILACGGDPINTCFQCGVCSATCPWGRVAGSPFNIRAMMHMGRLGYEGFETEDILYACTTCSHCGARCPRQVGIVDVVRAMRNVIGETGSIPKTLRAPVGSIKANGNPWGQERADRRLWMKDPVPEFTAETEYFLFVCCTSAYDGRSQNIARSVARLLDRAGVSYGVIGNEEQCCGESLRKIGAEEDFTALTRANIALYQKKGVRKIITTSPHTLFTLKKEYPELGGEFEVLHYTELLASLVEQGKLTFRARPETTVIYHDPCYLGRHNGIYDAPRRLLAAVPGLTPTDFEPSREDSLCCGGGGARIWMETKPGMRFSDQKVDQAVKKGAGVLATACPYCIVMLEDSARNAGCGETLLVRDISEVLASALA